MACPPYQEDPGGQAPGRDRPVHLGHRGDLDGQSRGEGLRFERLQHLQPALQGAVRGKERVDPDGEDLGPEPAVAGLVQVDVGGAAAESPGLVGQNGGRVAMGVEDEQVLRFAGICLVSHAGILYQFASARKDGCGRRLETGREKRSHCRKTRRFIDKLSLLHIIPIW